mgnify:CR=1 FL=1
MQVTEAHYNHLMDLIEQAKDAGLDHVASNEDLTPELLELLTTNGFQYEPIERDNEIKGYLIRWH